MAPHTIEHEKKMGSNRSIRQILLSFNPHLIFAAILALSLILFHDTVSALVRLAQGNERYTHTILIPLIAFFLLYWERRGIFQHMQADFRAGWALVALAITLHFVSAASLPLAVSVLVLVWISAFFLCYGTPAARAAAFPLCLMLLTIPLPKSTMDQISATLQYGSAEVTAVLFNLSGIPVFRQEYTFTLPGVTIEIAEECSGIRSSIALLITSLLAGHIFLQSGWKKGVLILVTIPITILKNAIRIVVLACLGVYVDRDYLYGNLHHSGGALFSLIGLAIFLPLLGALYRSEARALPGSQPSETAPHSV